MSTPAADPVVSAEEPKQNPNCKCNPCLCDPCECTVTVNGCPVSGNGSAGGNCECTVTVNCCPVSGSGSSSCCAPAGDRAKCECTVNVNCCPVSGSGSSPCGAPTEDSVVEKTIRLNKAAFDVPERYPRYRHGSHSHRLFATFGAPNHVCDNVVCNRPIHPLSTRFWCPRCDFDLCTRCFFLAPEKEVPLDASDEVINDRIVGVPFNVVLVR